MTRILSYELRNDKIVVTTDNVSRPEFVYKADKFASRTALLAEIEKSIEQENSRRVLRESKIAALQVELEDDINARNKD